jgi:integrase
VRVHIVPVLGKTPLAHLTPQQVQSFYALKLKEGLSSGTVMLLHAVLHRALDAAFRLGLVVRNMSDRADVPRPRKRHYQMSVHSLEQVHTFFAAIAGNQYEALYIRALTAGMRQGELLGLQWSDVDLDDASVQVVRPCRRCEASSSLPSRRPRALVGRWRSPLWRRRRFVVIVRAKPPSDRRAVLPGRTAIWFSPTESGTQSIAST